MVRTGMVGSSTTYSRAGRVKELRCRQNGRSIEGTDELVDGGQQLSQLLGVLHIVSSSVDRQDPHVLLAADPLLVPIVHLLEVVQRDPLLSLSVSLLDALVADQGVALEVDDGLEWTVQHQSLTEVAVDAVLRSIHVAGAAHDLSEDEAVGHGGAFGEVACVGLFLEGAVPELGAGVEGVELEGEGPAFGVGVVALEDVAAGSVGPLIHGLLDDADVEVGEQSALPGSQVALDGDYAFHF